MTDSPREHDRLTDIADYPYVAVTIQTTGIHPSTGRLLTLDALTFNDAGETGRDFHAVLNPDTDRGPRHQHGLEADAEGQPFSKILKPLDRLIDGRTLIVHDTPYTWGFLVAEARRAMTAAARANRSRGRNRRRRQRVGHVPTPERIIDTLATARRAEQDFTDIRLAAVAGHDATATAERAAQPEAETSRAATQMLIELYRSQDEHSSYAPDDLRADRFGLQRSEVRVDAAQAPRLHHNSGFWHRGEQVRKGMEFVVAPETRIDPDELIAAGVTAELNYVEKLSRETSLVVCNRRHDLVGKAMHAHRKDIELVTDEEFLELLQDVAEPADAPEPAAPSQHPIPNANNRSRSRNAQGGKSGGKRRRGSRGGNRRRRGRGRGGNNGHKGGGNDNQKKES